MIRTGQIEQLKHFEPMGFKVSGWRGCKAVLTYDRQFHITQLQTCGRAYRPLDVRYDIKDKEPCEVYSPDTDLLQYPGKVLAFGNPMRDNSWLAKWYSGDAIRERQMWLMGDWGVGVPEEFAQFIDNDGGLRNLRIADDAQPRALLRNPFADM